MEVVIKWNNIDGQHQFNEQLIEIAKKYQKQDTFKKFNFLVSLEANSRHLIYLDINTKNEGEKLSVQSNSYNLDNSLEQLKKELTKTIRSYNVNAYEKNKEKQKKWAEQAVANRQRDLEVEKRKIEEKEKRLKARKNALEKQRLEEQEKKNAAILKKLEKNRLESEKEDQEIIAQLEEQRKKYEEAIRIDNENKEKLERHMATLKFDVVAEDLQEDFEKQEEIKVEKQKLRQLQSEENECLVIIQEIKDLEAKKFDTDFYAVNEPFMLDNIWFYYDQDGKIYKANEEGAWEEITAEDIQPHFDAEKQPMLQELEWRLIEARKRRKLHLKEMADGKELIAELEASKHRKREIEKEQKQNFKKLKENYEEISKQTAIETKAHINPIHIEIAETHEPNEPFLTESNVYAYHDGEGRYYIADAQGNWTETTKDYVYGQSDMIDTGEKPKHNAGDTFQNLKGDTFYFDGTVYHKFANGGWEPCSEAEATDLDVSDREKKKIEKQKAKELRKTKKLGLDEQEAIQEQVAQEQTSTEATSASTGETQQWQDDNGTWWYLDEQGNYFYSDGTNWVPYSQDGASTQDGGTTGGQQWQDDNGTWWYLDEQGNYFYSDGTNWIPYQA